MIHKVKLIGLILGSAILALMLGCGIDTTTLVIDVKIGHSEISSDSDGFEYFTIDMNDEEDWADHKDNIKSIDNIGFELWVTNNGSSAVTGQFFASDTTEIYDDTTEVRNHATVILDGLALPPDSYTYVDWPTSLTYIRNAAFLKSLIKKDIFTVYALTTTLPFDITLDSARVIVTVTVKL